MLAKQRLVLGYLILCNSLQGCVTKRTLLGIKDLINNRAKYLSERLVDQDLVVLDNAVPSLLGGTLQEVFIMLAQDYLYQNRYGWNTAALEQVLIKLLPKPSSPVSHYMLAGARPHFLPLILGVCMTVERREGQRPLKDQVIIALMSQVNQDFDLGYARMFLDNCNEQALFSLGYPMQYWMDILLRIERFVNLLLGFPMLWVPELSTVRRVTQEKLYSAELMAQLLSDLAVNCVVFKNCENEQHHFMALKIYRHIIALDDVLVSSYGGFVSGRRAKILQRCLDFTSELNPCMHLRNNFNWRSILMRR